MCTSHSSGQFVLRDFLPRRGHLVLWSICFFLPYKLNIPAGRARMSSRHTIARFRMTLEDSTLVRIWVNSSIFIGWTQPSPDSAWSPHTHRCSYQDFSSSFLHCWISNEQVLFYTLLLHFKAFLGINTLVWVETLSSAVTFLRFSFQSKTSFALWRPCSRSTRRSCEIIH